MPFGCSENQATLEEFITKAKAALVSVGIIRDPIMCKFVSQTYLYCLRIRNMNFRKFCFDCFASKDRVLPFTRLKLVTHFIILVQFIIYVSATFEPNNVFQLLHSSVCSKACSYLRQTKTSHGHTSQSYICCLATNFMFSANLSYKLHL